MSSKSVFETLCERKSHRKFVSVPTRDQDDLIRGFVASLPRCPLYGEGGLRAVGRASARLVHIPHEGEWAVKETVGMVTGHFHWVVVLHDKASPYGMVAAGYLLEKLNTFIQRVGLGSVVIGDSRLVRTFEAEVAADPVREEPICVVCYGVPAPDVQPTERLPGDMLFYRNVWGTPLGSTALAARLLCEPLSVVVPDASLAATRTDVAPYAPCFEAVRRAHSAFNKQPWRIVAAKNTVARSLVFHLFKMHNDAWVGIDMGIAMADWEMVATESRLLGRWVVLDPSPSVYKADDAAVYVASWVDLKPKL